MKSILIFILFFWDVSTAHAAIQIVSFKISPSTIYATSNQEVLFTVETRAGEGEPAVRRPFAKLTVSGAAEPLIQAHGTWGGRAADPDDLEVVQIVEGKIKYRWALKNDGFYGDEKAGDGIYSRRAYFNEKKAGELVFVLSSRRHEAEMTWDQMPASRTARLTVLPVPSFWETLKTLWHRLTR